MKQIKRQKHYANHSRVLTVTCKLNDDWTIKEWSFMWDIYKAGKPHIDKYWLQGWQCEEKFPEEVQRLWKTYHLNGMTAWTPIQNAIIEAHRKKNPDWHYDYTEACNILKEHNLYDDNGYRYGTKWLYPADVNAIEMLQFWDSLDRISDENIKW